jgi:hypothetical protein
VLTLKLYAELELDYFEITGSTVRDGESMLTCERLSPRPTSRGVRSDGNTVPLPSRSIHPRNEPLRPAVIAGLTLAAVAVLLGFIILLILWCREYLREQRETSDHFKIQFRPQDHGQRGKLAAWR